MSTEGRINKLEKRAEAIYEKKIFICTVEGDTITHDGTRYTLQEWEDWSAANIHQDDTVIRVGQVEKDIKPAPGVIRLGIDFDEL